MENPHALVYREAVCPSLSWRDFMFLLLSGLEMHHSSADSPPCPHHGVGPLIDSWKEAFWCFSESPD